MDEDLISYHGSEMRFKNILCNLLSINLLNKSPAIELFENS